MNVCWENNRLWTIRLLHKQSDDCHLMWFRSLSEIWWSVKRSVDTFFDRFNKNLVWKIKKKLYDNVYNTLLQRNNNNNLSVFSSFEQHDTWILKLSKMKLITLSRWKRRMKFFFYIVWLPTWIYQSMKRSSFNLFFCQNICIDIFEIFMSSIKKIQSDENKEYREYIIDVMRWPMLIERSLYKHK